jgi:hypothetical protein
VEGHREDVVGVPAKRLARAAVDLPDTNDAVLTARGEPTAIPARSASVGSRSISPAIVATLVPGFTCPGHRKSSGARTPPSSVEPLRPFMSPFHRQPLGPLSQK